MPLIELKTIINAPIEIVFDLSRSIDFHSISTSKTKEKAIAGRTSGLIELNETVTWEATHLGVKQQLTSKITALEFPTYFRDEMLKGAFKSIYHEHFFSTENDQTIVIDKFNYTVPFGILGNLFDKIYLNNYMKKFIEERNQCIKTYAENDQWTSILNK